MSKKGKILINVDDVIGKRLGKLQVIRYAGYRYDKTSGGERLRHIYTVECDCGVVKNVRRNTVKYDLIHSCGCGRRGCRGCKDEE